jgi:hypothetical protein
MKSKDLPVSRAIGGQEIVAGMLATAETKQNPVRTSQQLTERPLSKETRKRSTVMERSERQPN